MPEEVEVLKEGVDDSLLRRFREENPWFKAVVSNIGTRMGTHVSLLINNKLIWHMEVLEKGRRVFSYVDIPDIVDDMNIVIETNSGEVKNQLCPELPQHPNLSLAIIGKVHTFAD